MLAIKTEWVPIQICILLNITFLIFNTMQMFANVENLNSNISFETHKKIFHQKKKKLAIEIED